MSEQKFPYRDTAAAAMLSSALQRYTAQNPGGLRALAVRLGIGQATVLSHMAHGRIGIPLDRVAQFAEILGLDSADFSLAVLKQRAPEVYAELNDRFDFSTTGADQSSKTVLTSAGVHAPTNSPPLNEAHRIAIGYETDLIDLVRLHRPLGLSPTEKRILLELVEGLLTNAVAQDQ